MARILIVEDNERLRPLLQEALRDSGYAVNAVATVADFLSTAQEFPYELFIVDLMLLDGDGLDAIRILRARGSATPILVITAKGKVDDRVIGLDAGADDYLIKPFNHHELLARVRALLRRPQRIVGPLLQVGKLEFNDATSEVHCKGNLVQLRPAERRLLNLLMRRSGTVVTKILIEEALSQSEREVSHNALEANMSRLRKALEEVDSGVVIETLRGMGYMLKSTDIRPSGSSSAPAEFH